MRLGLLLAVSLSLTALAAPARVSLDVRPAIVQAGHLVRITCRVPRAAENRELRIALEPVQASDRQLDGDSAVTWTMDFDRVPCWAEAVSCSLRSIGLRDAVVRRPLEIVGCD